MALVLRSTFVTTVRLARVPVRLVPRNDVGLPPVTNAARYRTLGGLQALALAVAGSVVTPALLRLAL